MLTIIAVLSLATYRITRFAILDSLIEEPRTAVLRWLTSKPGVARGKAHDLLTCPYCLSVWVAAALTAIVAALIDTPLPLLVWLAASGGTMTVWRFVEQ